MKDTCYDIIVIGGGPAGMAAAVAAKQKGVEKILILERDSRIGGILLQCIHNGFGLHYFGEELTGPEYAKRFSDQVKKINIEYKTDSMVFDIQSSGENHIIYATNPNDGFLQLETKSIILAMGCRERTRGALQIPGSRPAGVYTAGAAQRFVNIDGYLPGRKVVILGSGDIGLIMARRLTLEGAEVKLVCEVMPYSSGLKRNIVQCVEDFNIPLKFSHTVTRIVGNERVEGVYVAQVDKNRKPIKETEEFIECDTLLLSVGLIPENELSTKCGVSIDSITSGPFVNECMETSVKGIFACGNTVHVHDLVDYVTLESIRAGENAANYVQNNFNKTKENLKVKCGTGVRYTVPQVIENKSNLTKIPVMFRTTAVYKDSKVMVSCNGKEIISVKKRIMRPGEMQSVELPVEILSNCKEEILVSVGDVNE